MNQVKELYKIFTEHPVVTTDSRDCPAGSIFFALKGETFNGNEYAVQALQKGCAFAVVDEWSDEMDGYKSQLMKVDDVLTTLQQLAHYHRQVLNTPIIGITGTNGKTTTKELISAVLKKKYNVLYTQGNFNNHIGVPKTLLQLTTEHELAVIEMGANHPGEIKTLVNIVEPNYGIITNVGKAHLLGFGSFEGVIRTKGELYDFLREHGGVVFIDGNNEHLLKISDGLELVKYANNGNIIGNDPFLSIKWHDKTIHTNLIGIYNADNVLAAATIGSYFKVGDEAICEALSEYVPSNNRSQFKKTEQNNLIVDAYNANPTSMKAALDNFSNINVPNKLAILGDMKELGSESLNEHINIIQLLAEKQIEAWLTGEEFKSAVEKCKSSESALLSDFANNVMCFNDAESIKQYIANNKPKNKTILIKGSNGTRLFTLPDLL
ncbi:MAG: UDP-N-acetylmuramoyl-tripeptide--D-alanyl-D-alanine ligase [Bacteroidaceae bacterium]|nr:UDP-N-acetylmuramoyl-tripeptide--D-alanyl-D-alanine ligase [Bacteroidaceae bacterium]